MLTTHVLLVCCIRVIINSVSQSESLQNSIFNTLRPRQNGRHFADDIFKTISLNENIWILIHISLKFVPKGQINNIPSLVQMMAWRRPGDKPLSEPMMLSVLTHACVTRPQWVTLQHSQPGNSPAFRNLESIISPIMIAFLVQTGAKASPWLELYRYQSALPVSVARGLHNHDDVIKWKHFPVTGHLCGEFTGPRWIHRTKASDAEFWCFLWSVSE